MNTTVSLLYLPENRFDPVEKVFKNNLVNTPIAINFRYFKSDSALEETLFVDQVRILDDTKNWFMRKQP